MSEEWVVIAEELKKQGVSWTNLPAELEKATGLQMKESRIRSALRRQPSYKGKIAFEDKLPIPVTEDVWEYYLRLKELNEAIANLDTKQTKMTTRIDDD